MSVFQKLTFLSVPEALESGAKGRGFETHRIFFYYFVLHIISYKLFDPNICISGVIYNVSF